MKTKLLKTLCLTIAVFGLNSLSAQNYFGIPFGGTAPKIGVTVGVGVKLQLENFDSVAGNVDGASYYPAFNPPAGQVFAINGTVGTYYDLTAGNAGNGGSPTYRTGADVDISDITYPDTSVGHVLSDNQGQEIQMFTIDVQQSGSYTATVNYSHSGANKNYQMYLYSPSDVETSLGVLINANAGNPALVKTYNSGETAVYADSAPTSAFNLTAGTWVLRSRVLSATWEIDYITFTLNTPLSIDDAQLKANTLKAYPNPASDGKFNLNIDSNWNVYSVLGVKILSGKGKNVDLSGFAKGAYILKTEFTSKMLISK